MAGTGLAVYCILWHFANADTVGGSNSDPDLSTTSLTFFLDGEAAGSYTSAPYQETTVTFYTYNVTVYQNLNMTDGPHTFTAYVEENSMVLFDYFTVWGNGTGPDTVNTP